MTRARPRSLRAALSAAALAAALPAIAHAADAPVALAGSDYRPADLDERGLWMQADEAERQLKASRFVIKDAALNEYVRGVFCKTVSAAKCAGVRIYITRTPYFNASMMPNGTMQVWSGLFLRMRNEAQLAAVLGHEYAHYERRHGLQLFREIKGKTNTAAWLSFVPFGFIASLGLVGSVYAFNRDMEREADSESLNLLARAGYQPGEASRVWAQLRDEMDATALARGKKSRKDKNGGLFATHPPTAERMTDLAKQAEKLAVEANPQAARTEYVAALGKWWPAFIDDQIKMNDFGASDLLINSLAREGWSSDLLFARGELYRSRGKPADLGAAIGFYQEAISGGACFAECWRGLGLAEMRAGRRDAGKVSLREYLTRDPDAHDRAIVAAMIGE